MYRGSRHQSEMLLQNRKMGEFGFSGSQTIRENFLYFPYLVFGYFSIGEQKISLVYLEPLYVFSLLVPLTDFTNHINAKHKIEEEKNALECQKYVSTTLFTYISNYASDFCQYALM